MVTLCLEAMDPLFQRRMWDDKDTEAELEKEIQAELDNMSVSSLEISDETDSPSEVGSESDPYFHFQGEEDLPESVLYCINIIKNRSKNAENLVLQDLEDTEISGSNYGAVSNNPTEFMDELTSKYHADALELKKRMLFEIEKKLQMNSTSDTIPNSAQLPDLCNLPVDERFSSGDTDTISFGYYEVEERCRQSFAAWEEKQRELENQENKKFRALRDREEKLLQEEEEKRNCRIKQFEIEKKKIENIHKQEEEKLNVELQHQQKLWEEDLKEHEEFIRRLQLQMEEERKSLEELKAKERQRLADQQHNAAIKIQTRYRTFMAYQKYGSIIKERIKKKKMLEKQKQEWKEIADKIRQKDEERKKKMDEKLKRQEETNNQNQKEQEKRQKEYEKKKKILKFKKEQQKLMEEAKREKPFGELVMKNENKKDLVVKKENKKSDEWDKELLMKKENKNQDNMSKEISVKFFTKKKILAIKPLVEEEISEEDKSKHIAPENELKKTDIAEQEPVQKSNQELFGENISRQLIMIEFKKEQKENLVKHQELDESQNEKKLHESLATEQEPMQKLKQKLHREDMSKQLIMIDLEKEQKKNLVKHQELDELQNEKKLHESLATEKEPMQKLKQKLLREDMSRQLITIEFKKEQKENLVKHQELDELQNVKKLHESLATEQEPMQKLKQKLLREDMSKQLIMIDFEKEQKKNLVKHQELDELQNEKKLYESLATEEEPMQKLKQKLLREDMSRQLITIEFKKEQKENLVKHQELDELQNEKKLHESLATEQEPMQKLKQKLLREDMSKQLIMIDFEKEQKENLVKHQELDALQNEKKIHESLATEQEPMQKLKQKLLREDTSKQLIIDFEKEQKKNLIRHQELDELQNEKKLNKSLAKDFIKSQKNEFKENMTNYLQLEQEREKGSSKDENERNKSQEDREVKGSRNKAEQNRNTQILEEDNSEIMKEEKQMNVESLEDGDHFRTSLNLTLSLQKTESKENPFNSVRVIAPAKESDSQAIDNDENSDTNILTDSETIILNTSDIILNMENNSCKKKSVTLISKVYDYTGGSDKSSSLSEETTTVPSVMNEIPGKFCCMSTHSLKKITVSALIEEKRLAWIKICRPWLEIFGEIQTKKIVKTNRPRKCSVSKLPPLNTVEILQGGLWSTLQQVTTVTLQDLPGCSLCTLSECTSLQFLSLRRCGLTALEGLNNCKKLKYIDVQENQIQVINCENLENLCILLLNDNELTSFHGLDDCSNLQNIEASNNKITRIGGLESLKSLQQLIVDHNQLISTRGLCSVPTIMYLDCSYNNLTKVEGIKDCGLLQILKLQGNYLTELPSLENQVLLRELYLDDNSISTMEIISSYWLPLLQILTVSQNSLIEIVPLFQFVSLEKLDVSNNCLSDLTGVARWFDACFNLCDLSLTGNPLLQERNWRQSIFEILPALKILNGETLKSDSSDHEFNVPEPDSFSAFCQTQTQEFNLIFKKYITEKSEAATELQSHLQGYVIRRQINFCDKKNMAAMIIQRALRNYLKKTQMKKRNCYNTDMHAKREKAATLIQAVWKGFLLRKKLAKALASIKNEELEDDYEEVDIDDFIFDEAALEKEWFSLDSTNFPSQTQDLPNGLHQPKYSGYLSSDDTSLNLPYHPEQAWQNNEKENPCSSEDSQLTDRSESQNLSSSSDIKNYMKTSLRSKKEEKISEEWGFKDISTAQLMLKRAQKMKSKKARHKLDPAVRLALFKNNENKQPPVKPARKAYPARQGYFEVDEEELTSADTAISNEKLERSKELTYQWLHSQVGSYETTCPKNSKGQTHFLPVLDPDVLNGGRVQLVENLLLPNNLKCKEALFKSLHFLKEEDRPTFEAQKILSAQKCKHFAYNARLVRREDVDVDLVSMNSGSALAQNREKNNQASRHSAESSFKVIAVPGIKNTKKKWVSHRDYPVEFSDGWESGKWKAKTFN
ncbi:leucine-rich repeat- and IQ domain-containing protein 1 isoform X6 [Sminthopsis crassicaudata]|uniref:leucine-rich repeat- and IQ domain-containing protein 1 isoform X6 n=1 Tax=Sminthopsis crassicaudata TaxID=9301 RepID=UPI003D683F49